MVLYFAIPHLLGRPFSYARAKVGVVKRVTITLLCAFPSSAASIKQGILEHCPPLYVGSIGLIFQLVVFAH